MVKLHWFPGNASLVVHMILEELATPYELVHVDRDKGAHKSPEYLKLNPAGRIPVLEDGELVIFETAAIVLHLCDKHQKLAPPLGSKERAKFYQWLMYLTNTVQAEAHPFFYPEQHTTDASSAPAVKAKADARWSEMFQLLDRELATKPYLLGDTFTALDPYLTMLGRWGRSMKTTPPRTLPHLGPYLKRMAERPAILRALQQEKLSEPWFG